MSDRNDDALFDELKEALARADEVPEDVLAAAKDSFTWRTIDAELAELVFDSAADELVGVRGATTAERQLTFRMGELEIELLVDGRRVTGQLVPPQQAEVDLSAGGSMQRADVDALGVFVFEDVPPGPVKLTLRIGAQTIATEWTLL